MPTKRRSWATNKRYSISEEANAEALDRPVVGPPGGFRPQAEKKNGTAERAHGRGDETGKKSSTVLDFEGPPTDAGNFLLPAPLGISLQSLSQVFTLVARAGLVPAWVWGYVV